MRIAILAAAAVLAAMPAAAQSLKLTKPADTNKDGVVTDQEQADYYAKQADKPVREIGVAAPKASGDQISVKLTEPENELDKRAVPASDFEKAQDAQARKAQSKDD
ncbi:hypothetical protein GVN21_16070 [Caulobacter sp. SLTY]|uniref:hypothetical protein n=1 Tax=Caulobacter sp. SLTY TaxID=2683262 RepID=UPI001411C904|nr:hypothetical protein [Caulobacter sp. SLTY]NBB16882.1 hypothetical protein [Caulobacter sp. SLTY]